MTFLRLAVVVAALVLAASAPAFDGTPMNELTVGSSQRSVAATAGSGCKVERTSDGGGRSLCGTAAYPLQLGRSLMVRRGHAIAFELDWPAESLEVKARSSERPPPGAAGEFYSPSFNVVADGPLPARRWVGRVPVELGDGFVRVGVFARYPSSVSPSGDRDFEVGLHVLRRGRSRVKVPKLVGRSYGFAIRELERRGLRWRIGRGGAVQFDSGPPVPAVEPNRLDDRVIAQWLRPTRRVARGTVVALELRRATE